MGKKVQIRITQIGELRGDSFSLRIGLPTTLRSVAELLSSTYTTFRQRSGIRIRAEIRTPKLKEREERYLSIEPQPDKPELHIFCPQHERTSDLFEVKRGPSLPYKDFNDFYNYLVRDYKRCE